MRGHGAERRGRALRADQRNFAADLRAERFGQPAAERHGVAALGQAREAALQHLVMDRRVGAEVGDGHAAHQHRFDPAVVAGHQRLFDQRRRAGHARRRARLRRDLAPVGEAAVIALDHRMAVQPDDLVEQLRAKAVHHAHHDDQRGDAEHDRDQADRGDEKDESLAPARQQVAAGDHPFIAGQQHWPALYGPAPAAQSGRSSWAVAESTQGAANRSARRRIAVTSGRTAISKLHETKAATATVRGLGSVPPLPQGKRRRERSCIKGADEQSSRRRPGRKRPGRLPFWQRISGANPCLGQKARPAAQRRPTTRLRRGGRVATGLAPRTNPPPARSAQGGEKSTRLAKPAVPEPAGAAGPSSSRGRRSVYRGKLN